MMRARDREGGGAKKKKNATVWKREYLRP